MKLYNYNNVIALKANQHNYQNTKDGHSRLINITIKIQKTGSINAIALQANQHNFQKYNSIIISIQDCLYKTIQLRQCDELHLHLIILSKISIQMSHTTHKKINSSLSLFTDHIVIP